MRDAVAIAFIKNWNTSIKTGCYITLKRVSCFPIVAKNRGNQEHLGGFHIFSLFLDFSSIQTVALIYTESLIKIPVFFVSVLFRIHMSVCSKDDFEMTREIEAIR